MNQYGERWGGIDDLGPCDNKKPAGLLTLPAVGPAR